MEFNPSVPPPAGANNNATLDDATQMYNTEFIHIKSQYMSDVSESLQHTALCFDPLEELIWTGNSVVSHLTHSPRFHLINLFAG